MNDDWYRDSALATVGEHLSRTTTNAIARSYVLEAVYVALDAYEDELLRASETRMAYAVMLGAQPMLVCPSRRAARAQKRLLKRMADGTGAWRVVPTQVVVLAA